MNQDNRQRDNIEQALNNQTSLGLHITSKDSLQYFKKGIDMIKLVFQESTQETTVRMDQREKRLAAKRTVKKPRQWDQRCKE